MDTEYYLTYCESIVIKASHIVCEPGELDEAKTICENEFGSFSHFTIGKGNSKYHMLHLPNNSCGLYYALRQEKYLTARRAVEPTKQLRVFPEPDNP